MLTDKVRALRRKPIGEAALEALIALDNKSITTVMQGIGIMLPGEYLMIDSLRVLDSDTFEPTHTSLSSQTNLRLFDALLSLDNRGFIEKIKLEEWLKVNKLNEERKQKVFHFGAFGSSVVGRRASDCFIYEITVDGKQALLNMPNRVQAFWTEKNATPRYMIASSEINGVRMASGIYPIERETEDKVFVRKERVSGAYEFDASDPILTSSTYQRVVGIYINRNNVLAMDVQPEDFNRLYQITENYRDEFKQIQKISGERIELVWQEEKASVDRSLAKASDRVREEVDRLQAAQLAREEDRDEQGFVLTLEDCDQFKP